MPELPPTAGPKGRASVLLRCSRYVRSGVMGSLNHRLESLETVHVVSEAYRSQVCLSHVSPRLTPVITHFSVKEEQLPSVDLWGEK